jgi:hypothetical protein
VVVHHLGLRFCSTHAAEWFGDDEMPGALGYAGSAAPSARPTGRVAAEAGPLSSDAAPAPLSEDDVLDLLERDGWRDFELDLFMAKGQSLADFADEIAARFDL